MIGLRESAADRDLGNRELRPGDVVEVRAPAEIMATLDENASIDGMPFMPEMLRHSGKRFKVTRRVEKICDTVSGGPPNSRRVRNTVLLDDLRCDGGGHGGCQAGCRIYWKESWLRRVDPDSQPETRDHDPLAELEELAAAATRVVRDVDGVAMDSYRCQATEALRATEPMSNWDLRQYVREVRSGNVGLLHFLRVAARALRGLVGRRLRLVGYRPLPQCAAPVPTKADLDLQPGEIAQVRSREEIAPSIDKTGRTRGLSFDWEMSAYCGSSHRVQERVERIINEQTGQMIEIASDCLILEGVVCSGEHSRGRWFCPRAIYPYWREAWLQRIEDGDPESANGSHAARVPRT